MAPQTAYSGPTALTHSKYASHSMRQAQPASFPTAISSTQNVPVYKTIATREQIAATRDESGVDSSSNNTAAQLAIAQGNALKEEVDRHAARFSKTISSTVTSTRRLLQLIREAVQTDDPAALQSVDHLWVELEQLFAAAQGTKEALPNFLEKQRSNMALYHASVVNETYRDSQNELNMQHRKASDYIMSNLSINLQHGLILEHQQAFQDYKAQTAAKLKCLEDLQERVSRLTLEKGNFRGEAEKYAQLLEHEQATKAEDLKKIEMLQKEVESLVTSKKHLLMEVDGLQKTIGDLQGNLQGKEQQLTDRFTAELDEKTDLLAKETAKAANLNTIINNLQAQESSTKMEIAKLKTENKLMSDKYNQMTGEHSEAFSKSNDQNKKIKALTADTERLHKEVADLRSRLSKVPDLEARNAHLFKDKTELLETIGKLSDELKEAKDSCLKVNKELTALTGEIRKIQSLNETLRAENSALLSKQTERQVENNKSAQPLQVVANSKKGNTPQATAAVGGAPALEKGTAVLEMKIKELENQETKLRVEIREWTELAQGSYKKYKEFEKFRFAAVEAERQIEALRQELATAKASQSNGNNSGGDATYWKAKYDTLLASLGN